MLFVIDMQNEYLDSEKGEGYIKGSEKIVGGIIEKIKEAEDTGEKIYYTSNIPIKDGNDQVANIKNEKIWGSEPYNLLKPYLEKHTKVKKSYYAIPPRTLLDFQKKFKKEKHIIKDIKFVGVETHICVLANAICIQSAFPEANIIIYSSLCRSHNNSDHEYALKIMEGLGMEVRR